MFDWKSMFDWELPLTDFEARVLMDVLKDYLNEHDNDYVGIIRSRLCEIVVDEEDQDA